MFSWLFHISVNDSFSSLFRLTSNCYICVYLCYGQDSTHCHHCHINFKVFSQFVPKLQFIFFVPGTDPSEPLDLEVTSGNAHELIVKWKPPKFPNGKVTHYKVMYHKQALDIQSFAQRDYCRNRECSWLKFLFPAVLHIQKWFTLRTAVDIYIRLVWTIKYGLLWGLLTYVNNKICFTKRTAVDIYE